MAKKRYVCANCGHIGKPGSFIKGSFLIELALWGLIIIGFVFGGLLGAFAFLLIAAGYSIYRMTSRSKGCPKCKAPNMIPEDTPKGQELVSKASAIRPES